MKKEYVIHAVETIAVKLYVESDKSPEDFDNYMEFYHYADYISSKDGYGKITHIEEVDECE